MRPQYLTVYENALAALSHAYHADTAAALRLPHGILRNSHLAEIQMARDLASDNAYAIYQTGKEYLTC